MKKQEIRCYYSFKYGRWIHRYDLLPIFDPQKKLEKEKRKRKKERKKNLEIQEHTYEESLEDC